MVVTDRELEWDDYAVASSALTCGTVHDVAAAYERTGAEWPVSGDATVRAGTVVHHKRRPVPAEAVVTVRCEDCPWGLDVQGWEERAMTAQKLAQRHADRRNHTVTATEAAR